MDKYHLAHVNIGISKGIKEAKQKLNLIRKNSETAEVFSFKKVFAAPNP